MKKSNIHCPHKNVGRRYKRNVAHSLAPLLDAIFFDAQAEWVNVKGQTSVIPQRNFAASKKKGKLHHVNNSAAKMSFFVPRKRHPLPLTLAQAGRYTPVSLDPGGIQLPPRIFINVRFSISPGEFLISP